VSSGGGLHPFLSPPAAPAFYFLLYCRITAELLIYLEYVAGWAAPENLATQRHRYRLKNESRSTSAVITHPNYPLSLSAPDRVGQTDIRIKGSPDPDIPKRR